MQLFKTSSSAVPQICLEGNSLPWQMEVSWWLICKKKVGQTCPCEVPWLFWCQCQGRPGCQTFIVASQMALKWVLELKSCTHTLHSSLAERRLSCTDKNTPEIIFMRLKRVPPCLGERKQWDEQTLMTKPAWQVVWPLFDHQGVHWSPPPQGLSGHRRCWRALNIVRSDYNSPTWAKTLSRAELISCMITVFRCSRSVLKYSARSDLAFN